MLSSTGGEDNDAEQSAWYACRTTIHQAMDIFIDMYFMLAYIHVIIHGRIIKLVVRR